MRVPDEPIMRADLANRARRLAGACRASVEPPEREVVDEVDELAVRARRVYERLEPEHLRE